MKMRKPGKLSQFKYYVYHDLNKVFGRMDDLAPVLMKEFALDGNHGKDDEGKPISASQAAHDYMQSIVNPENLRPGHKGPYVDNLSDNCESHVKAAYQKAHPAKG